MRTLLDDVEPADLRPVYRRVLRELATSGELRRFVFLGGSDLVSLDGTGYFSKKVQCPACQQKVNAMKKTIYSLAPLQQVLVAANRRYLVFISEIETPEVGVSLLNQLTHRRVENQHSTGGHISRSLKRLRVQGLLKKVGKHYKYYLTPWAAKSLPWHSSLHRPGSSGVSS